MGSLGPTPFAGMLLGDLGAEVVRVDRPEALATHSKRQAPAYAGLDHLNRNRRRLVVDAATPDGIATLLRLITRADVLLEGFRPGVMERLGLGPDECCAANEKLVYCRMTGWGQDGPLARSAGHDINYIALSGALSLIGRRGVPPTPPPALIGDFGGGGTFAVIGILAALVERSISGRGDVIDAAIVDGSALLTTMLRSERDHGRWHAARGTNAIDTGSYFYDVYETADGCYITFGSLEPKFHAELMARLELDGDDAPVQHDVRSWPAEKDRIAAIVRTRTRDEWSAAFEGTDVCFAPVLELDEAPHHPHNVSRRTFVDVGGVTQPAPAPRFARSTAPTPRPTRPPGADTEEVLRDWGFADADVERLRSAGAVF